MTDDLAAYVSRALRNVRSCVGTGCTELVMMDNPVCASCRLHMSPEDLAEVDA